jgi:hypothetical protein
MAKAGNIEQYLNSFDVHIEKCGLFEKKAGSHAIEWFEGPFLPRGYRQEFLDYCWTTKTPMDCIVDKERFKGVYSLLSRCLQGEQDFLFKEYNLENSLENIAELGENMYKKWCAKKSSGSGFRKIAVPKDSLRALLVDYILPFIKKAPLHECSHGGEEGWTVEKSLRTHVPFKSSLSFDLKDANDQVTMTFIFDFFYEHLSKYSEDRKTLIDTAGFLSNICTVRHFGDNVLPQGSPISTALFNRVMLPIDRQFQKVSKRRGMKYSRWIDDFIISSPEDKDSESFLSFLGVINKDFRIRPEKVFYQNNPAYFLGCKVDGNNVTSVSKEEGRRLREKKPISSSLLGVYLASDRDIDLIDFP